MSETITKNPTITLSGEISLINITRVSLQNYRRRALIVFVSISIACSQITESGNCPLFMYKSSTVRSSQTNSQQRFGSFLNRFGHSSSGGLWSDV